MNRQRIIVQGGAYYQKPRHHGNISDEEYMNVIKEAARNGNAVLRVNLS